MSTPTSFDFAKFDYQIDPKTYTITQVDKGRKKGDKSQELIELLAKCQSEMQKSLKAGLVAPLTNVNTLNAFTTELETFLKNKQLATKTPYKLRQRPEEKKLDAQITQLKELSAGFATISLKGIVKKVTQPNNEVLDILALGKALLSTPKPLQESQTFQEGKKAYIKAILNQKDLAPLLASDPEASWLDSFLQENPSQEEVQALLKLLAPLGENEKIKTLLETNAWLDRRFNQLPITSAQKLFVSYLIDFKLPARENEPYVKEVLQQGLTEMVEGKSSFKWLETFLSQKPNDKEVSALENALKLAQSQKVLSKEAELPLLAISSRYDALSQEKKSAKFAPLVRLEMAYTSQFLAPRAKSPVLQELYTESIERCFTPHGSLQWIKRFLQEKPSNEEVQAALALLKFISSQSLADQQIKAASEMLIKSFDELSQNQKEKKLSATELLGLAYGIEVKLLRKEDPQAKLLLEEGLARLFAIEGSLKGFERILAQEPSKTQVQELVSILHSLATQGKIGKKLQDELKGLVQTYTTLSEKGKNSPQECLKIAFALHVDVTTLKEEKLLEQALVLLLPDILEPLLAQELHPTSVEKLLTLLGKLPEHKAILAKIIARYEQLNALPKEMLGLSPKEMLGLANFIETKLGKVLQVTGPYIKKGLDQTSGLARSLLVDNVSGDVFVLSKRKVEILDASGTFKRFTSAIRLPTQTQAKLVAQAVGKHEQAITKPKDYQEALRLGKAELVTHKKLEKGPGIWPLLFWCEYTKTLGSAHEIPKLTAIYEFAEGDLIKIKDTIAGKELLTCANWLVMGLAYMHALGYVHCDLKLENALFKFDADGNLIVGWSDFGLTINIGENERSEIAFVNGYYGTHTYTAPEVFGRDNYDGDFQKADVWALGCTLYQLCYKEAPPWTNLLNEYHSENKFVTEEFRADFNNMIEEFVAEELKKLPEEGARSKEEKLKALLFQMLRADPALRINMQSARNEMQTIMS